jgi:glycosyltransferase involved in cell wall biosynthesis
LVPPEDSVGLADTLAKVLSDPVERSRLVAAAHDHAPSFDIAVMARQWEGVFDLVGRRDG